GMTAVLGGDQEAVLATIARHGLTPANVNAAGQIVAAGTLAELDAFAADPPAGARLRPLQVAGAFHTRHMAPAVAALRDAAADIAVADPAMTLLSDAAGVAVDRGARTGNVPGGEGSAATRHGGSARCGAPGRRTLGP